jgi:hypothetical protein
LNEKVKEEFFKAKVFQAKVALQAKMFDQVREIMLQVIKKRKGGPTSEERDLIIQGLGYKIQPLREILS